MASRWSCQSRVLPSISVNRKVIVPDGGDTAAGPLRWTCVNMVQRRLGADRSTIMGNTTDGRPSPARAPNGQGYSILGADPPSHRRGDTASGVVGQRVLDGLLPVHRLARLPGRPVRPLP